jgi:spore coat polysaccharide biosynthesis protein SpsF
MTAGILITARLKSTRLPLKVIKPLMGRPMICHLLDRLKLAKIPQKIIICTSPNTQDDPLVDIAAQEGVEIYRGDPDDVLSRLTKAAEQFNIDTVVNCTADNPFVDPEYIDKLIEFHLTNRYDFSKINGLPFGTFSYALARSAMEKACNIKDEKDTEVWGGYFTETGLFSWGSMNVDDPELHWPDLRLTVDMPEDFELVTQIFNELYKPDEVFPLRSIVMFLKKHPELIAINSKVQQKPGLPIRVSPGKINE